MAKYRMRFFIDAYAGDCLWADNEADNQLSGYPVALYDLDLSDATIELGSRVARRAYEMTQTEPDVYGVSYSFTDDEVREHHREVAALLAAIRSELGPDYEIVDETGVESVLQDSVTGRSPSNARFDGIHHFGPEQAIARAWAEKIARSVVQTVITYFEEMPQEYMQSGDDSPLKNVWEEYCAQIQGEESAFWETYSEIAEDALATELDKLDPFEKLAVWLQTDEGQDWNDDLRNDQDTHEDAPVYIGDLVSYLKDQLDSAAADYESRTLEQYLNRLDGYDEDEDEYDKEEDEEEGEEGSRDDGDKGNEQ